MFYTIFPFNLLQVSNNVVPLQCVFHSIRFKVNKVGVRRYTIFFAFFFVVCQEFVTFVGEYVTNCDHEKAFSFICWSDADEHPCCCQ